MEEQIVGFRFHPTDEEIVGHYLRLKMDGQDSLVDDVISEIDLARVEPWDLPGRSRVESGDQVWYFFYRLDCKYPNSKRTNRKTKTGYWKSTGKIRSVKANRTGEEIGTKRTLVFYRKEGSDTMPLRTDWVIHEYKAKTTLPNQTGIFLCKLKNKADVQTDGSPYEEGEPSSSVASDFDNQAGQKPNLEGISTDDILETTIRFSNDPQVYGSEDELDPEKMADSFLVDPYDHCDGAVRVDTHRHHTESQNLVREQEVSSQGRIQLQRMTPFAVPEKTKAPPRRDDTACELPRKSSSVVDPKQYRKLVGGFSAVPATMRSKRSAVNDGKNISIHFKTPIPGNEPSPPSVCIVNALVGLVLTIIILWEMLTI